MCNLAQITQQEELEFKPRFSNPRAYVLSATLYEDKWYKQGKQEEKESSILKS